MITTDETEFAFADVQTSNVFSTFDIHRMFQTPFIECEFTEKCSFYK